MDDGKAAALAAAALGLGAMPGAVPMGGGGPPPTPGMGAGSGGHGAGGPAGAAPVAMNMNMHAGAVAATPVQAGPAYQGAAQQTAPTLGHSAATGGMAPSTAAVSASLRQSRVEHEVRSLLQRLARAEQAREAAEMEMARMRDAGGDAAAAELRAENVSLAMRLKTALALNVELDRKLREAREEMVRVTESAERESAQLRQKAMDAKEDGQKHADGELQGQRRLLELETQLDKAKEELAEMTALRLREAQLKGEVAELKRAVEGYIATGGGTAAASAANAELVHARANEAALRREVDELKASMTSALRRVEDAEMQSHSAIAAQRAALNVQAGEELRAELHTLRANEERLRREMEAMRTSTVTDARQDDAIAELRRSEASLRAEMARMRAEGYSGVAVHDEVRATEDRLRRELDDMRLAAIRNSTPSWIPRSPDIYRMDPIFVPAPSNLDIPWRRLRAQTEQCLQRAEACHRLTHARGDPILAQAAQSPLKAAMTPPASAGTGV